jgi:hypothetical protein
MKTTAQMKIKSAISMETFIFLVVFLSFWGLIVSKMGTVNMMNTIMNTAYQLLISTVFYIMAIAVIAGAISELLLEFGVIAMLNKLLSPLIFPIFGLPGASITGIFATYLSDNPAILSLANNKSFKQYFRKYQIPALTNIGTAFGMGMIVTTFMLGLHAPDGENFFAAALIGNLGASIGAVVSTRLMLMYTGKLFGRTAMALDEEEQTFDFLNFRFVREGNVGKRVIEALLDGGKSGVAMGLEIIPGVLAICTLVMMLTNGASPSGSYTGAAYEGVAFLPYVGEKLQFILKPLFGFSDSAAIAVPITSLGAAGAAISLIPQMVAEGKVRSNDIAVFCAICMCWSGYLSTHVAMMESLGFRDLTGKAIFCHTLGGLVAGISANWIFKFLQYIVN